MQCANFITRKIRNDKDRFSSSKRCGFRTRPAPVGPASAIATDLESRTDPPREIRSRRFEPQRNVSDTCAMRKIFVLATLTPRNIITRDEPGLEVV